EQGYIAIGWAAVGNLAALPPSREAFKQAVAAAYPNTKIGAIPVHAGTLFRFAKEMKVGDLVIYPSKPDRMVNFGTTAVDYQFLRQVDGEGPNRRRVSWVKQLPRASFSQTALHEIGSAVTLFQIRNNVEEFMLALKGQPLESADVDKETVEAT